MISAFLFLTRYFPKSWSHRGTFVATIINLCACGLIVAVFLGAPWPDGDTRPILLLVGATSLFAWMLYILAKVRQFRRLKVEDLSQYF